MVVSCVFQSGDGGWVVSPTNKWMIASDIKAYRGCTHPSTKLVISVSPCLHYCHTWIKTIWTDGSDIFSDSLWRAELKNDNKLLINIHEPEFSWPGSDPVVNYIHNDYKCFQTLVHWWESAGFIINTTWSSYQQASLVRPSACPSLSHSLGTKVFVVWSSIITPDDLTAQPHSLCPLGVSLRSAWLIAVQF